MQLNIEH